MFENGLGEPFVKGEDTIDNIYTSDDLKEMQSWDLERKIRVTQLRIMEWYEYYEGNVYISFSGGKDSTVLLDMARRIYPDIEAVFIDTGLEYPEIKKFVKTFEHVVTLHPQRKNKETKKLERYNFKDILKEHGYPVISKKVSNVVAGAKQGSTRWDQIHGTFVDKNTGELSKMFNYSKYEYLLGAPFKISDKCCTYMKKNPANEYNKTSGKKPIIGMMAGESVARKRDYLKTGCNAFDKGKPQSQPMGFWTEQDVLTYLLTYQIPYCSIYGDIVKSGDKLETTGERRTGCIFCLFGCHLEHEPNRFQRMELTHPKLHDYCIRSTEENGLGLGEVLDFIGVKYTNNEVEGEIMRTKIERIACDQENSFSIQLSATAKTEEAASKFVDGFQKFLNDQDIDGQLELCPTVEEAKQGNIRYIDAMIFPQESSNANDDFKIIADLYKKYKTDGLGMAV